MLPALLQEGAHPGLEGQLSGVGLPGHVQPGPLDLLRRLSQPEPLPGVPGGVWGAVVGHIPGVVLRHGGDPMPPQKRDVNVQPDPVGVQQGAVQIKKDHAPPPPSRA